MKYLILLFVSSFFASFVSAQQNEQPFIEVRGIAKTNREVKSYLIDFIISPDNYSEEKKPLEDVKKAFFQKAATAGFGSERFKEDQLGYALLQYGTGGSLYHFETTTEADVIKFTGLLDEKNGTITTASRRIKAGPVKDKEKIYANAFENGKNRAETIAKMMGKKLGRLISIVDYSTTNLDEETNLYYQSASYDEDYCSVTLRYAID